MFWEVWGRFVDEKACKHPIEKYKNTYKIALLNPIPSFAALISFFHCMFVFRRFPASSGDEISCRIRISGSGSSKTTRNTRTTGTIRTPRVGFGTDRPYIALFWGPTFLVLNIPFAAASAFSMAARLRSSQARLWSSQDPEMVPGRSVPKKGYIGTVGTKTHSGGSDGTGGSGVSGGFPGPWP